MPHSLRPMFLSQPELYPHPHMHIPKPSTPSSYIMELYNPILSDTPYTRGYITAPWSDYSTSSPLPIAARRAFAHLLIFGAISRRDVQHRVPRTKLLQYQYGILKSRLATSRRSHGGDASWRKSFLFPHWPEERKEEGRKKEH